MCATGITACVRFAARCPQAVARAARRRVRLRRGRESPSRRPASTRDPATPGFGPTRKVVWVVEQFDEREVFEAHLGLLRELVICRNHERGDRSLHRAASRAGCAVTRRCRAGSGPVRRARAARRPQCARRPRPRADQRARARSGCSRTERAQRSAHLLGATPRTKPSVIGGSSIGAAGAAPAAARFFATPGVFCLAAAVACQSARGRLENRPAVLPRDALRFTVPPLHRSHGHTQAAQTRARCGSHLPTPRARAVCLLLHSAVAPGARDPVVAGRSRHHSPPGHRVPVERHHATDRARRLRSECPRDVAVGHHATGWNASNDVKHRINELWAGHALSLRLCGEDRPSVR